MRGEIKIDKLSSFCKVIAGQSPKGSAFNEEGIGVEFHQGKKAFGPHYIEPSNVWTTEITKLAQPGDILMSVRAPVGPTNFTDREVCIGRGLAAIRCKEDVLPHFILYALKSIESKIVGKDGAVFNSIGKDMIEDLPVPAFDRTEQQRIVDILDQEFAKIDALKANAEKSLQAAKDLFQATLKRELEPKEGWKSYCLKDVCKEYGDYGMSLPSKPYDGIRYLRITDITEWGDLNDDRVSVDAGEVEERYMVRNGDILFARTGATVGKTLVYEDKFGSCCYAGYLIRYRPDQSIVIPRMLYYITHSASYYEWVAISQKSATLPNISAKLYNAYELTLPHIKEQERIISRLDALNDKCQTLQDNYQKALALCDDLKQSLLRKAFNGEL